MESVQPINNLYGSTLVTLVNGMRLSMVNKKVDELTKTLLALGYSRQEIIECVNVFLKEEK